MSAHPDHLAADNWQEADLRRHLAHDHGQTQERVADTSRRVFLDTWHVDLHERRDGERRDDSRPAAPTDDPVHHPAHYGGADDPYEAIKVIEAWQLGFNLGNTAKYLSRAGRKSNRLEDLKKARWYLDREIANGGG